MPTTTVRDGYGRHVLLHRFAQAAAGIEATTDQIEQAVLDDDLNRDVGMVEKELRQSRRTTAQASQSLGD